MPLTSAFHDQLSDLHDNGGEISTLSASQQALLDVIDSECPGPPYPPGPSVHTGFDTLDWKRLIRGPLAAPERISLITTIFSNRDEVKMVRRLYGDDAQTFVNVIYDARLCTLSSPKNGFTNFKLTFRLLLIRRWMTSIKHRG